MEEFTAERFWQVIDSYIDKLGLTQESVMKQCKNVSPETYKGWKYKKRFPDIVTICRLAEIFNTSVENLIPYQSGNCDKKDSLPADINSMVKMLKEIPESNRTLIYSMIKTAYDLATAEKKADAE